MGRALTDGDGLRRPAWSGTPSKLWVCGAALVAALAAGELPAAAQPELPPLADLDEVRSEFWEHAARPRGNAYAAAVSEARGLWEANAFAHDNRIVSLLDEAIDLEPEQPAAYFWLGMHYLRREQFAKCTHAFAAAFDADPTFRADVRGVDEPWRVERNLGWCAAGAGDFDRATVHLSRVVASGDPSVPYDVEWRLGDAYMALGRLDEAVMAYEAVDRRRSQVQKRALLHIAVAVAFDRDEQIAASRDHLEAALDADPGLLQLQSPYPELLAGEDTYYRGLAYRHIPSRRAEALYEFRHYVALAGEGPWARRAAEHVRELGAMPMTEHEVRLSGDVGTARASVTAAVIAAGPRLQRCVAATPNALYRIRIVRRAPSPASSKGKPKVIFRDPELVEPGTKITAHAHFDTDGGANLDAISCLQHTTDTLSLPRANLTLELYVTAATPDPT